VINLFSHRNTL